MQPGAKFPVPEFNRILVCATKRRRSMPGARWINCWPIDKRTPHSEEEEANPREQILNYRECVIYTDAKIYIATGRYRLYDPASKLTDSRVQSFHLSMARERRDRLQRLKVSLPGSSGPTKQHDRCDPSNLDGQYSCWMAFSAICMCERCETDYGWMKPGRCS